MTSSHRALRPARRGLAVLLSVCVVVVAAVVTGTLLKIMSRPGTPPQPAGGSTGTGSFSRHPVVIRLPARPESYLGAFVKGVPASYAPMLSFAAATGQRPRAALYYSGWYEAFRSGFAGQAARHGAVPFVQIDPAGADFKAIAGGVYDGYLDSFATAVARYGAATRRGVIVGFGHEMNGDWFGWGNGHVTPALFVAAWRHIVRLFRAQGADDVTWIWTVNIIDTQNHIPSPVPWWPGDAYVTWVGIDGYFLKRPWTFASLFGPTIKVVRSLTLDPILISETGAAAPAGQPAKIADLFAGVRGYGLLGFTWFDAVGTQDWRLRGAAVRAAFGRGAGTWPGLAS